MPGISSFYQDSAAAQRMVQDQAVKSEPLIGCVVLNTNRRDDTIECLTSLFSSDYRNIRVIVLDCQSTDGSVDSIRARFSEAHVVPLDENKGYAGNNNVGIRMALEQGADWVFVLNEDTVFARSCLSELVRVGESNPRIGVVGPLVYHHDEPTVIQSAGGKVNARWEIDHFGKNQPDVGQFSHPHDVQWISGCAILVRRDVIEQVGPIDERFFIYWEETEWCIRAAKAGWRIVHVPQAKMWHKGVQRDYRPEPHVTYYSTRNRLLTLSKHRAPLTAWGVAWAQLLRTLVSWTVRPKWTHLRAHRNAMWRGINDFLHARWGQMVS